MKYSFITSVIFIFLIAANNLSSAEKTVIFSEEPTVKKSGNNTEIHFAVNQYTDVAIFIEDNKGQIIRHLVAGALGANAPKPFKKNSLSQDISWDGKANYGKDAGTGPFKVRIALGMHAKFEKILISEPENIQKVKGLAVGPMGELFVAGSFGAQVPNWTGWDLKVFTSMGKYKQTLFPSPSYFTKKEFNEMGITSVKVDDRDIPVYATIRTRSFLSQTLSRRSAMAMTKKGELLLFMNDGRIAGIKKNARAAWGKFLSGPLFFNNHRTRTIPFMAVSSDDKWLFVTGAALSKKGGFGVYRVDLPGRNKAELIFGNDSKSGAGVSLLGKKRGHGIAIDGKGHLLVADTSNDRILVLSEKDGSYISEIKIKNPDNLLINKKSGEIYVSSAAKRSVDLFKFKSIQDNQVIAKLTLKMNGNENYPWVFALDESAKQPIIWAGGDAGIIKRIIDQGTTFKHTEIQRKKTFNGAFVGLNIDRYGKDKEIYARCGGYQWYRYNEVTKKADWYKLKLGSAAGTCIEIGPKGKVFAAAYPYHLFQYDLKGQPLPWGGSNLYPRIIPGKHKGTTLSPRILGTNGRYAPVSMTYMTHTVGIKPNGNIFMFVPGHAGGRPPKKLIRFDSNGNQLKGDPIIWKVSDVAIGPKFDAQGNIYIAEQVKPLGQIVPPEFKSLVGDIKVGSKHAEFNNKPIGAVLSMYGSIVKFSPKGGTFHWGGEDPYKGKPKFDPSLKTIDAATYHSDDHQRLKPLKVTGSIWIKMGISHIEKHYCNCESTRFDVDEFGRVYYPDLLRFQIRVMDTNANDIMHVGSYGNRDSMGKNSVWIDKDTGDSSKAGKGENPLDSPGIAFSWLTGVVATDNFLYAGDSLNKRLMQIKITYQVEKSCPIK